MYPLTKYRSKPAVPLGAKYRLIDVPISNCLNSGFNKILVLTQYNSESLNKHIFRTYKLDSFSRGFVEILAASQSYENTEWFQGTADSVRQSLPHIHDPNIDDVIVLSGDQLYNLDLQKLQAFHYENDADVTVACHPVQAEEVHRFGIMGIDARNRIRTFVEKPKDLSLLKEPGLKRKGKAQYLANMGIYFFKKKVLAQMLTESDKDDFGREIIPDAIGKKKMCAFVFDGYWSDIGTISSYYRANMLMTEQNPSFDLYDEDWQMYTRPRFLPPAKITNSHVQQSIIAEGCILDAAAIEKSVIGVRSCIGKNTRITKSMLAGNDYYLNRGGNGKGGRTALGIGSDCRIHRAIIDKNVSIGNRVKIMNASRKNEEDAEGYSIRDGIVVVHKGAVIPDNTVI
jgi:glucose-1-phosphate adenylyltransferase